MTTKIEWVRNEDGTRGETWNPTTGCDRVSPGCDHCYALTLAARLKKMGQPKYQGDGDPSTSGPGFALTVHRDTLDLPLRWKRPRRVFVNSMSDLFHPDVPETFIRQVWDVMAACPQHTFQILTKRPQRMAHLANDRTATPAEVDAGCELGEVPGLQYDRSYDGWLPNVWLGTSVENDRYTFRADHLRRTPAAVRFLSLEPLLGPLPSLNLDGIDWVIVGGESGPGARPMHPGWVRDIRNRCVDAKIPFFFKQWGGWCPGDNKAGDWTHEVTWDGTPRPRHTRDAIVRMTEGELIAHCLDPWHGMARVGKRAAGCILDGRTWDEMP